ncbi:MAG: signal recognition particle-docking protein FtsY [Mycoplasma sp.]
MSLFNFKKIKEKIQEKKKQTAIKEQNEANRIFKSEDNQKNFDEGLRNSSTGFSSLIDKIVGKHVKFDDSMLDDLEEQLISYDVGYQATRKIIDAVEEEIRFQNVSDIESVKQIIIDKILVYYIQDSTINTEINLLNDRTNVVLVVGVNGVGKTTSIAKIANHFVNQNKKVLLVAGDTFRAGAVEQLKKWSTQLGVDIVTPKKDGQDPASVIFEGLEKGYASKYDLIICDTSGRLQNKVNLMNELNKIVKIIQRFDETAPHETLLVLDATTGQSGLNQAKAFKEVSNPTGIILTKMDSSSKGGIVLAIKDLFDIPVKFIGLGESIDDLKPFELEQYIEALISGLASQK